MLTTAGIFTERCFLLRTTAPTCQRSPSSGLTGGLVKPGTASGFPASAGGVGPGVESAAQAARHATERIDAIARQTGHPGHFSGPIRLLIPLRDMNGTTNLPSPRATHAT